MEAERLCDVDDCDHVACVGIGQTMSVNGYYMTRTLLLCKLCADCYVSGTRDARPCLIPWRYDPSQRPLPTLPPPLPS